MANRAARACIECGKTFYGTRDNHYCPACARTKKSDTVVKIRTCQDCGIEFFGGPRARRCPDCAHKARKETGRKFRQSGPKRPLGSIDKCVICGQEYTVVSGRQIYCSEECQRIGVLEWQREHKKGYAEKSGQTVKKQQRRDEQKKVCSYCLRKFTAHTPTSYCSEHCRQEAKKLQQCMSDIKRGFNRDLEKYEKNRDAYRKEVERNGENE